MTTPEPVSPAPDTEALQQQVAEIASEYLHACPHCPKDKPEWVAGEDQVHQIVGRVVTEREAGLRADLDRARSERDELSRMLRDMARRASEQRREARQWYVDAQNAEQFLRYASDKKVAEYREDVRENAFPRLFGRGHPVPPVPSTPEELAALEARPARAELARVSGDRTIPDDAAERLAAIKARASAATAGPWQAEDAGLTWTLHGEDGFLQILKAPKSGTPYAEYWPNAADGEFIESSREDVAWLLELVDRLATPTTGPAPAAADRPQRFICATDRHVPGNVPCPNCQPYEEPAAPQAPAEPKKQCAWWWDTKQCPDWAAPGGKYCNGHQRDHNDLLREVPEAAREDTAPPAWTGHDVDVRIDAMGWGTATCQSGCGVIAEGHADVVDPAVDTHRADTLRPSGPVAPVTPANPTPEEKQ